MAIRDDRTANRNYALPFGGDGSNPSNDLADDVLRLRSALTAIDTDVAARAPLASPAFTGTPTAPTAAGGTNTTQIATTAFVAAAVAALVNAAPGTLDTLNELATALGNDPNYAATITAALAAKAPLASPALTGTPTAPTATGGTNTTQIATTAYVVAALASYVATTRQVSTQHSLTGGGTLAANLTLSLLNDSAAPGANKVYGTNGAGTRGWIDAPAGAAYALQNMGIYSMAATPAYAATPRLMAGTLSVANSNRDGTGTIVTLGTAGASGSRLEYAIIKALATTTAGMIRLFLHDGTNAWLIHEEPVTPVTPTANVPAFSRLVNLGGINIPATWSVRASTERAETFEVIVCGADF